MLLTLRRDVKLAVEPLGGNQTDPVAALSGAVGFWVAGTMELTGSAHGRL